MLKAFLNNWQAKLASVALATLFYFNLQNSKILTKEVNVKIEYPKLGRDLVISKASDQTVPVKVEGVREYVNFYSPSLKVYLPSVELKPGENIVTVTRVSGAPAGLRATILKNTVKVIVDSSVSRSLELEQKFIGDPPKDYVKSSHFVSPASLVVVGNPSQFDKVGRLSLPPISLKDKTKTFTTKYKVPDLPAGLRYRDNVREVSVTVNIIADSSTPGESIVLGVPVKCDNLDKNLEAEFSEQEVSVKLQSKTPLRSIQIIKGLSARVVCAHKFDPKTKKILPDNKPVVAKVRLEKDNKSLKSVEIQGVFPDRISILYRVRPDLGQGGGGQDNGDGNSDSGLEEPLPEPEEE